MVLSSHFIIIIVAVRRCYENLRRIFLEQQSGKENFVENQSKRRKYRSRRERVGIPNDVCMLLHRVHGPVGYSHCQKEAAASWAGRLYALSTERAVKSGVTVEDSS